VAVSPFAARFIVSFSRPARPFSTFLARPALARPWRFDVQTCAETIIVRGIHRLLITIVNRFISRDRTVIS
jgi:hypothetical protein